MQQVKEDVIYAPNSATMSRFSYVPLVIFLFAIIFLVLWAAMGKSEQRRKLKSAFGWGCVITLILGIVCLALYYLNRSLS